MSAMTMEAELQRIRELYDPRRDSTDIFARQYRQHIHDDYEDMVIVDSSGARGAVPDALPLYSLKVPMKSKNSSTESASGQQYDHGIQFTEEERRLHCMSPFCF